MEIMVKGSWIGPYLHPGLLCLRFGLKKSFLFFIFIIKKSFLKPIQIACV